VWSRHESQDSIKSIVKLRVTRFSGEFFAAYRQIFTGSEGVGRQGRSTTILVPIPYSLPPTPYSLLPTQR
jgi:hypothetical protein